jgi:hypothetical protein
LHRYVKISRKTAPSEKISDASGSVWRDCHTWTRAPPLLCAVGRPTAFKIMEPRSSEDPDEFEEVMDGV